ncbi:MAG: hypothetical protein ACO25B_10735 [Chitinophagaceae bacterium]
MSEITPGNGPETPRENEISDYLDQMKQMEMQGYEAGIKKARNALFITAGLVLIGELITIGTAGTRFPPLVIAIIALEVGAFAGLAFWTRTKPFSAIVTGLILLLLMWVAVIMLNGEKAIYSGIVVKVIIISMLVSSLKDARAWENMKKTR